jgi:ligand-binding sensor domain-containing protein/signal transduction histidine kinase
MKSRRYLALALAALFLAVFAFSARAIDPNRMASQYIHDRWGSARGFTGGSVSSIAQTPDGYLWIGSEKGLFRFDGLTFRSFPQAAPSTLPIGPVQGLTSDALGNLWVILQSTKILRYRDGKFELGRDEAEAGITSATTTKDGAVLFASLALGPLTYDSGKFEILSAQNGPTNYATSSSPANDELNTRRSWATGITAHRLAEPNSAVLSMIETFDGRLWLGTQDKGLFFFKDGRISSVPSPAKNEKINCLLPADNGELWIGTDGGLRRWNGSVVTSDAVPPSLVHQPILALARDRDSNIWIGTSRAIFRFNAQGVFPVDASETLQPAAVNAIFQDREGNIWLGTSRGIERLRDSPFVAYSISKTGASESNGPVYVDDQGRTWFAPLDGGLYWLKNGQVGSVSNDGLNTDVVYSITGAPGEIWVGRQQGGLTHLRFDSSSFTAKTFREIDGLAQNNVYSVFETRDGSVWAGTLNGGVSRFKDGKFSSFTSLDGLASNTVSAIEETSDGTMWFGTPNGVTSFSQGKWQTYSVQNGSNSGEVNCLLEGSGHNLWIGSAGGVSFLASGRVQVPPNLPDALRDPVFGVAEDNVGWLWISTSNRVLRINREKLLSGTLASTDLRQFGLDDGLSGLEGVKRQRSVAADSLGRIWFSMNHGLSVVDPVRLTKTSPPVLIKIDSVSADGAPLDLASAVRIPSSRHRLSFAFSGLSLSVPERVRYRYRLDGFDHNWSEPAATRDAIYTNLSPGSYTFRVIASNSDGVWSETGTALPIDIVPQFYQTKWFFLLAALLAGIIIWLAYQRHVQQVTERLDLQYKERLSERTRIARELHDTLLQSFQGLMLHFQRARNLLPTNPAQAIQRLDSALAGAEQAIVEGRNAIHDIRSTALVNEDLAQAMTALGSELSVSDSGAASATLNVLEEGAPRPLDPVVRDEIYRIVREALRNAFTHARAKNIEAEIAYGEKLLRIRIRDDGLGIDPHVLARGDRTGHWGLPGMRERAQQIGGHLDVWSELGAGTEVELTVPAPAAYKSSSAPLAPPATPRARVKGHP